MPITVTCDECSESHRVKDDAVGKRFKCKGCGKSLKVVAPAPPEDDFSNFDDAELNDEDAEVEEAEAYSRKKAPKRATASRKSSQSKSGKPKSVPIRRTKVPLGMDCVFFGFLLYILVILIVFAVSWSNRGDPRGVGPILYWLTLSSFAATIVTTVGKLMCLTAPPQMSGKGTIYAAVGIDVLSIGITVASLVTTLPALLTSAINLLSVAGFVCFILFLQQLGDFMGERDLRERGSGVLKMGVGVVVLWLLILGLAMLALAKALPLIVAGLGISLLWLVLLVVGIIFVVRYVGLLSTCRYALSNC